MFWLSPVERSDMSALSWIAHLGSCSKLRGVRWSEMKWLAKSSEKFWGSQSSSTLWEWASWCRCASELSLSFLDVSCGLALSQLSPAVAAVAARRRLAVVLQRRVGASESETVGASVHPVQSGSQSGSHGGHTWTCQRRTTGPGILAFVLAFLGISWFEELGTKVSHSCPPFVAHIEHVRRVKKIQAWYVPITHDGSMVLLYMVCHGSHQEIPPVC